MVHIPEELSKLRFGDQLAELRALGLYAEIPRVWSDWNGELTPGQMDPPPGSVVPTHSIIRFRTSSSFEMGSLATQAQHPRWVVVPKLVGLPWRVAEGCSRGWAYKIAGVAPLSAAGSRYGLDAFVVAAQSPPPGTRLPWGVHKLGQRGYFQTIVTVWVSTRAQNAPVPADANGVYARITAISLRSPRTATSTFPNDPSSGRPSLGLFLAAVPWPLPARLRQPGACTSPLTVNVHLRRGGSVAYGPCRRPPAIDRLAGAMREAVYFHSPGTRDGTAYPHPVRAAYIEAADGTRSPWYTRGGSYMRPQRFPLRLVIPALARVLPTPPTPRPCTARPWLVLELNDGTKVHYGACAQAAVVEQLRGALEYAASHRAPTVLAYPATS